MLRDSFIARLLQEKANCDAQDCESSQLTAWRNGNDFTHADRGAAVAKATERTLIRLTETIVMCQNLLALCDFFGSTASGRGSSDVVRVVCNNCNRLEVCPSVTVTEFEQRNSEQASNKSARHIISK